MNTNQLLCNCEKKKKNLFFYTHFLLFFNKEKRKFLDVVQSYQFKGIYVGIGSIGYVGKYSLDYQFCNYSKHPFFSSLSLPSPRLFPSLTSSELNNLDTQMLVGR